jgi:hypothetical protein
MNEKAGVYVREQIEIVDTDIATGEEVRRLVFSPIYLKDGVEVTDPELIKYLEEKNATSQPSS